METKAVRKQQEEAITRLRETLKPGDTVYTILRHVSRSGMSRSISVVQVGQDGGVFDWTWAVARAIGERIDEKHDGVKMGGCGMDMGFETVYRLSWKLFPDGFDCIGEKCPAADHNNRVQPPDGSCPDGTGPRKKCGNLTHGFPQAMKDGRGGCKPWHHEKHQGAYALKQRWL